MYTLFRRDTRSPFVRFTRAEHAAILWLMIGAALVPLPFALGSGELSRVLLYLSYLLYVVTLALPFTLPKLGPSIFNPLIFYVLWVGIKGLFAGEFMLPISGLDYHRALGALAGAGLDRLVAKAFLLEALALLVVYIAFFATPINRVGRIPNPKAAAPAAVSLFWVGVSGVGLLALATIGGGLDQVLMQRGLASDQRIAAQVGGHWGYLAGIAVVAPLVWIGFDRSAVRKPVFWGIVVTALVLKFFATGSRGGTLTPLIMIGCLYVLQTRKVPYRYFVLGVLGSLLLVGGLGQYRLATMQAGALNEVRVEVSPAAWIERTLDELRRQVSENSGQLAVLGSVPNQTPYLWGESYLSVPFVFLPSAIFGEKPPAAGRLNSTIIFGNPLNTIPVGQLAEAYWNFSYFGILLVSMLFGATLKLFAQVYRHNPDHPLVMVLFLYVLFYFEMNSDRIYSFVHLAAPAVLIYLSMLATSMVFRPRGVALKINRPRF